MSSNIDNPMDRLAALEERIKARMAEKGLNVEHVAFSPSVGPGGQHMVQIVMRLEPSVLMEEQTDVSLTDEEQAAFEALMGGAAQVDSSEVDRDKHVKDIQSWLEEGL